jgi:hypothetical protein
MAFMAEWIYKEQHPDYLKKAMGESPLVYGKNNGATSPGRSIDQSPLESQVYSKRTTQHNMDDQLKPTMFDSQIQESQPEQGYKKPEVSSDEEDELEYAESVPDLDTNLKNKKMGVNKNMKDNRTSVSAEVFGKHNKKENFKPRVIPKAPTARSQIKDRLLQSFLFKGLEEKDLEICIDAMEIKQYSTGQAVINQGEDGNELFVVESGSLDCSKLNKGNPNPQFLLTYRQGMSFGE